MPVSAATILTSLMVKLRCESSAERVPGACLHLFFQLLYPFAWVNRRDQTTAAAAGGSMLIRADALRAAAASMRSRCALIDDCALARLSRPRSDLARPDRAGHQHTALSALGRCAPDDHRARPMPSSAIRRCGSQARSCALTLAFLVPPVAALFGDRLRRAARAGALDDHGAAVLAHPAALSAVAIVGPGHAGDRLRVSRGSRSTRRWQSMRGKGGLWKGRFQAAGAK